MNILFITYPLSGLITIAIPIGFAFYLIRKHMLEWRFFWIGIVTFVAAYIIQVGVLGFLSDYLDTNLLVHFSYRGQSIFTAVFQGLSMALIIEFTRYAVFRWWVKDARSWGATMLIGTGYGSVTSILGAANILLVFATVISAYGVSDLTTIGISAENVEVYQQQIQTYWSTPWYETLLPVIGFVLLIPIQLALSLIVMQTFIKKQWRWMWAAISLDAISGGLLIYVNTGSSDWLYASLSLLFAIISVWIIVYFYRLEAKNHPTT